jgi:hypothetical protein
MKKSAKALPKPHVAILSRAGRWQWLSSPAAISLLLAAAVLISYWPVLRCDFVGYDDIVYVTDNRQVLRGLSWDGLYWAFTNLTAGFWHPLTWLSLMLDVSLFGQGAMGFHLTNLLLHTGSTALVFLVLRADWGGMAERGGGGIVCAASTARGGSGVRGGT